MDATGWPESYSGGSIHVRPDGRLLSVFVQGSDLMSIESLDGGEDVVNSAQGQDVAV